MLGYHFHRLTPVLRPKQSGFPGTLAYRYAKEINVTVQEQIEQYIATQPEPKQSEMLELHDMMLALMPACQLWFLDGKDEKGKIVSNPTRRVQLPRQRFADPRGCSDNDYCSPLFSHLAYSGKSIASPIVRYSSIRRRLSSLLHRGTFYLLRILFDQLESRPPIKLVVGLPGGFGEVPHPEIQNRSNSSRL